MTSPEILQRETTTERLVRGLDYLLSEESGCRLNSVGLFGVPESLVLIKEEDTRPLSKKTAFGAELSASYVYDLAGEIEEIYAHIAGGDTECWIELPVNDQTGTIDAEKVTAWSAQTKQQAGAIMSRLLTVVFRA